MRWIIATMLAVVATIILHTRPSAYIPWLERMLERQMTFKTISVMGGEPFLHSDLLGFMTDLRAAFDKKLVLSTNGFWLSEKGIEKHRELLALTDLLNITIYPPFLKRFGDMKPIEALLDEIRLQHPKMDIVVRQSTSFYVLEFTDAPLEVDSYCGAADCTCLLPDGRLARCGPGAFADFSPHVSQAFRENSSDLFYDLRSDTGDFWMWRRRWPLDACSYCTHFTRMSKPWEPISRKAGSREETE